MNLTQVDLNLLVVFEALMRERHVGRAAQRLFLSQSATSHALSRLRDVFGDPLFVRNPRGIEPTARSRELDAPIVDVLSRLRLIVGPQASFDPATLRRTFTIAAHDYAMAVVVPSLMADLQHEAPGVDLRFISLPPERVVESLDRGEIDLALGGFVGIHAERVTRVPLFSDRFVGVARSDHPRLKKQQMSRGDFANASYALVVAAGSANRVDAALAALDIKGRAAVTVPSFLALPLIIERTDVVGILPERLALHVSRGAGLTFFDLPMTMKPVTCSVLTSAPLAEQSEMKWLLGLLKKAAKSPA
ncbi:MAG TPA: LysR substrate-binding domain-containing protein [Gemmatimonadaceae bacterium]|nr:LysR substrate-binding domain-containing protein [Gemmatimonadaceae bacterium]